MHLARRSHVLLALLATTALTWAQQDVISVRDVVVSVERSNGDVLDTFKLGSAAAPIEADLIMEADTVLKVSFVPQLPGAAGSFVPQQATLRVDSSSSTTATVAFVAEKAGTGEALTVRISQEALATALPPGPASVWLVLGDASARRGLDVLLVPRVSPTASAPGADVVKGRLPDLQHTFRQPEKRINFLVPMLGLATIVGLGALALARIGALRAVASPAARPATPFFACLGGVLALLALFWLKLTLLQTLAPFALLLVATSVTGRALSSKDA